MKKHQKNTPECKLCIREPYKLDPIQQQRFIRHSINPNIFNLTFDGYEKLMPRPKEREGEATLHRCEM